MRALADFRAFDGLRAPPAEAAGPEELPEPFAAFLPEPLDDALRAPGFFDPLSDARPDPFDPFRVAAFDDARLPPFDDGRLPPFDDGRLPPFDDGRLAPFDGLAEPPDDPSRAGDVLPDPVDARPDVGVSAAGSR